MFNQLLNITDSVKKRVLNASFSKLNKLVPILFFHEKKIERDLPPSGF